MNNETFPRDILSDLTKWLDRREAYAIKGPRQSGKNLKLLYDTFEKAKFIVTGSSSLELSDAMAKFLVGRVFFFELFPFNFHEFLTAKNPRLANVYKEKNNKVKEFLLNDTVPPTEKDLFQKEFTQLLNE